MVNERYDALVVGSGMGGSCSAALLAHYGYRVLLVEQLSRLGGRFSTVEIDGFKCPTGALIIQRGTSLEKTFKVTGAEFDVVNCSDLSVKIGDECYTLTGKGMGRTLKAVLTKLKWRHYKFGIMSMLMIFKSMLALYWRGFRNLFRSADNKIEKQHDPNEITYRQWMEKYTDDPQIIEVNHAIISSLFSAINDFECPASDVFEFYASMASPTKMHKFGYARRGNIELIKSLAKVVTDNGGKVMLDTEVKKIKIENGKATGVVLKTADGEIGVDANIVISNAGPMHTLQLAGEENLTPEYVQEVKSKLRPIPIIMGLIESDVPLLDREGLVVISGTKAIVTGVTLTLHSDQIGPKGKHLLWTCGTPASCINKMDKELEIKRNEADMEKAFPLYKEHGRVLKWWMKDIDDPLPCMRTWPGYDIPVHTPIPNLYNVGDGSKEPGWTGSPACARNAWTVVKDIRKTVQPEAAAKAQTTAAAA